MDQEFHRRSSDQNVQLNHRLDVMEQNYAALSHQVTTLENNVNIVKVEQGHLKDLFGSRFTVIEKSQELLLSKLDHIMESIVAATSDATQSPMGRTIHNDIRMLQTSIDAHTDELLRHARWLDRVDGVLTILKWVGAGGLLALGVSILRLIKVLP